MFFHALYLPLHFVYMNTEFPPPYLFSPPLPALVSHVCKDARNIFQVLSIESQGVVPAGWGTVTAMCHEQLK
jgi:hypothetical protein